MTLNFTITEIFKSIQGESSYAGKPCTFIRLTGCPLRCNWCDTAYGFDGGKTMDIDQILKTVKDFGAKIVEITGGEPLAQAGVEILANRLNERGHKVLLETSGSISIKDIPAETHIVMDLKCPGSKMEDKNHWENLKYLKATDEIKFVIASLEDFRWAQSVIFDYKLTEKHHVLISPAWGLMKPDELSKLILESNLDCRLNIQQHKFIWGPRAKGV